MGIWEVLNNPNSNHIEFDVFRTKAGLNSFVLTAKQWIIKNYKHHILREKTTDEMKDKTTFTDRDWDFNTIWDISAVINDGYPYLRFQQRR